MLQEHTYDINFKFAFSTGKYDLKPSKLVAIERIEGIISFYLEYNLDTQISNAVLKNKERSEQGFIYVFEFDTLDKCLEWLENPDIFVSSKCKNGDVYVIQREMDAFMREYEENELRSKKKKKKLIDEDGFEYYE